MDETGLDGRALPLFASLPLTALAVLLLIYALRSSRGRAMQFVIFAVWLRFILSAFHQVTFARSPIGLSWNALASIFVCALGVSILRTRALTGAIMIPIGTVIASIILSGIVNGVAAPTVDMVVKFTYLGVVAMATSDAIEDGGWDRTLRCIGLPFLVPLAFQLVSILLGVVKASESDGSVSYIGGYNHEAAFSLGLAGAFVVLALRMRQNVVAKMLLLVLFLAGLYLANYRTVIVATAPLFGVALAIAIMRSIVPQQRGLVMALAIVVLGSAGGAVAVSQEARFADIGTVISQGTNLIKPPRTFSVDDRHVMSGRPLIWSEYLYGYAEAKPIQHLVGLGPSAWVGVFHVYAHNTLVSALYELGVFGFLATLLLWIWMLALAWFAEAQYRLLLVTAHLCFIVLNMATMPLWMIEGMIFYGLLCGCTINSFYRRRVARSGHQPRRAIGGLQSA